jgi:hypothetical protein
MKLLGMNQQEVLFFYESPKDGTLYVALVQKPNGAFMCQRVN